jgi:Outer membrane efflux protein
VTQRGWGPNHPHWLIQTFQDRFPQTRYNHCSQNPWGRVCWLSYAKLGKNVPAVEQARETYRLVMARSRQGDVTPAELTEAEAGLTRAEQDYANSVYDYLTAVEHLQYAMGTTETPLTPGPHP